MTIPKRTTDSRRRKKQNEKKYIKRDREKKKYKNTRTKQNPHKRDCERINVRKYKRKKME